MAHPSLGEGRDDPPALAALRRRGWKFGLEPARALDRALGSPFSRLPAVHVVGTNGKGTTAAWIAAYLSQRGLATGLSTSPHLSSLRERFRLDGAWIPASALWRLSRRVLAAAPRAARRAGRGPTYFEAAVMLGALWFSERGADAAVHEAGLGGRLDATNVHPRPLVTVITPVGCDHEDVLGRGIPRIAREKAAVLRAGVPACAHQPHPAARRVVVRAARGAGALLWLSGRDFRFWRTSGGFRYEDPGFRGDFSLRLPFEPYAANAALALAAARLLELRGVPFSAAAFRRALGTRFPGRFEKMPGRPPILLDGAHNPPGAAALARALAEARPKGRWTLLAGLLRDKDAGGVLRPLAPFLKGAVVTRPPAGERAADPRKAAAVLRRLGVSAEVEDDWSRALALARRRAGRGGRVLVTGSLYLVGACREKSIGRRGLARI